MLRPASYLLHARETTLAGSEDNLCHCRRYCDKKSEHQSNSSRKQRNNQICVINFCVVLSLLQRTPAAELMLALAEFVSAIPKTRRSRFQHHGQGTDRGSERLCRVGRGPVGMTEVTAMLVWAPAATEVAAMALAAANGCGCRGHGRDVQGRARVRTAKVVDTPSRHRLQRTMSWPGQPRCCHGNAGTGDHDDKLLRPRPCHRHPR